MQSVDLPQVQVGRLSHVISKNTGAGCHSLLQGTFLTQRSHPCLSYHLHRQEDSLSLAPPCCCSAAQLYPTLHSPMTCSTPGFPVLHYLPEFVQTHVHWVGDAIQPSNSQSSPSPPAFDLSQHQGLFQWIGSSHQMVKVLELQFQYQAFQWILGLTALISLLFKGLSRVFSNITVQKHQFFGPQPSLSFTSVHDYWKNHSFDLAPPRKPLKLK